MSIVSSIPFDFYVVSSSPANKSTDVNLDVVIEVKFNFAVELITAKESVFILDEESNKVEVDITVTNDTVYVRPVEKLLPGTTYRLIVQGLDGDFTFTDRVVKSVFNVPLAKTYVLVFTTVNIDLQPPVITKPQNFSYVSGTVEIEWTKIDNATGYEIEISTTNDFSRIVYPYSQTVLTDTKVVPDYQFEEGKLYYCRVRSVNGTVVSKWSEYVEFIYQTQHETVKDNVQAQPATNISMLYPDTTEFVSLKTKTLCFVVDGIVEDTNDVNITIQGKNVYSDREQSHKNVQFDLELQPDYTENRTYIFVHLK